MSIAGVKNSSRIEARRRVGTHVTLTLDDGSSIETRTRSAAWCLGDWTPVVLVEGKTGGWSLSRVAPRLEAS